MWYRRITEHNDVDLPPPGSQMPIRKPRQEVVVLGQTSSQKVVFVYELPKQISVSKERKRKDVQDDDSILFKRVRLISKKTRVRRIKRFSGPFTGLAAAKNGVAEIGVGTASGSTLEAQFRHIQLAV